MSTFRGILLLTATLAMSCNVAFAIEAKCSACKLVAVSGEFTLPFTSTLTRTALNVKLIVRQEFAQRAARLVGNACGWPHLGVAMGSYGSLEAETQCCMYTFSV